MDSFYELDENNNYTNSINSILWQKFYPNSKYKFLFDNNGFFEYTNNTNDENFTKMFEEFFLFRLNYVINDIDKSYILEGIHFAVYNKYYNLFSKYPIIILGKGVIKSTIDAAIRNYKEQENNNYYIRKYSIIYHFFNVFKTNILGINFDINKFKNYLIKKDT